MFLKAGAISLFLLVCSRLLGLARESAQAAAFGSTGLGDVAVLMLTLPDWLAGLLASGALAYVLLPHWAQQGPAGQGASQRLVARALLAQGLVLGLAIWIGREPLVVLLAAGAAQGGRPLGGGSLGGGGPGPRLTGARRGRPDRAGRFKNVAINDARRRLIFAAGSGRVGSLSR